MSRRSQLFLNRTSYRRRRLADAARLLPIAGAIAFGLPLLIEPTEGAPMRTSFWGLYIVCIWAFLIVAAFLLAPKLEDVPEDAELASDADTEPGAEV